MISGDPIPRACQLCGHRSADVARRFRNFTAAPGGAWVFICGRCRAADEPTGAPRAAAPLVRGGAGMTADGFVAVAKPNTREIAIVFAQGHVIIAEAEARALVATLGSALAILDGEHAVQNQEMKGTG